MVKFAKIIKLSHAKIQTGSASTVKMMAVSFQQIFKCLLKSNELISGLESQSSS